MVSPVLSNIYLDRLDTYIERALLPAYNQGDRRTPFRPYMRLWRRAWERERCGDRAGGRQLRRQMQTMPSRDPHDPGYRRLRYCRYADDWLLGFAGPRREAEQIKDAVGRFLQEDLRLELSASKTLITHGRTRPARFLGYEVAVLQADHKHDRRGHRSINAAIGLKVPIEVIRAKCTPYRICTTAHRSDARNAPSILPSASSPSRYGHRARTTPRSAGHRGPRWRQEATGSAVGWDQPGA